MRLMVDVDAAIDAVQDVVSLPIYEFSVLCDKLEAIAVDAEPVKHSEWKYYHKKGIAVCKNCSFERDLNTDFGRAVSCPNCGAKMDREVDHGKID